ncbi:LOW QUALITY PROTEIN: cadherin-8-like [Sciurus carolinensis]|uniref:LOW QUALITY PROTEIN: cadherin-8-like n=1 Tax=Sciurus carolinensis TaxID=30640 RepID=UPI001FB2A40B|nr:LOW QUALITY PROTEIN: cadherin-8-like [Sciurus carolinensis]
MATAAAAVTVGSTARHMLHHAITGGFSGRSHAEPSPPALIYQEPQGAQPAEQHQHKFGPRFHEIRHFWSVHRAGVKLSSAALVKLPGCQAVYQVCYSLLRRGRRIVEQRSSSRGGLEAGGDLQSLPRLSGPEAELASTEPLDFETKKSYTLKVEAANVHIDPRFSSRGPFKDTATVKIVVEDADEPPVFSSPTYLLEVHENAALNSVIGQVTARDPDITSSPIRFSIDRHTDLERQFNINADDGKITLATPLDRELSVWHNITIIATEIRNHSQISRVPVAIKVLDVNDNAPEFASEYEAFLCENGKPGQVIQTVSAMDKDDPKNGHYFLYSLLPEMVNNPNFTIKKNEDNSLSILAKHNGFNRQKQEVYLLPIIISDSGNPPLSSTSTLTIRVCGCSNDGVVQSCNVEAYVLPIGLSMGALIAILACIILLLVIVVLFVTLRRHKNEPLIIKDDEDVRENIIRYDDEGGGEEDTEAFDIATLQNPDGINGFLPRKDIKPDLQFMPRQGLAPVPNGVDVDEFINVRLHEADNDPTAPPYDSIQIYGYEGRGSVAGSLSSLESTTSDSDQNFDYLSDWGPRFKRLGELYSVGESDKET